MLTIGETLKDINEDINKLKEHAGNAYLRNVFQCAFIPEYKFVLPEGTPPYKVNGLSPVETKGTFWQEARKLHTYCRKDLKPLRREMLFVQMLEALDPESVGIMLAIKEQTLSDLYNNITYEKLLEVGYF
jgi:hypothetical protein